jgi:hypothetical protein
MDPLITVAELAVWCLPTVIDQSDPFAALIVDAASVVVRDTAQQPTWTAEGPTAAPARAKQITASLAKRSYQNPDSEISSAIGPLSSSTVAEMARFLHLTQAEIDALSDLRPAGSEGAAATLWVQPTNASPRSETVFLGDVSGSDWMVPFLDEDADPYYFPLVD